MSDKIFKIWRGSRESYNKIAVKDYWTRYSVKETNGVFTEYYGNNRIAVRTGQLEPVIDIILSTNTDILSNLSLGDRYLLSDTKQIVEKDETGIQYTPMNFNSVRVINKGLMEYQFVNEVLTTYEVSDWSEIKNKPFETLGSEFSVAQGALHLDYVNCGEYE